ncbi:MAG TPA: hypothetical protein VNR90_01205, partial [Vicinamibacterales bacterium]|nr:hypothetical protein [Vicinamibacterales bacterium]
MDNSVASGSAGSHEAATGALWWAATAAVAALLTALLYGITVGYGFHYDDYHFVRPYTARDLLAAFHGPWDSAGIEAPYYRPLTICLYAARFAAFGVDARAHHAASLILFALAATLFGLFAARICGWRAAGPIAAAVLVLHPGMPYSAVAWVTNQMHLAAMIVVFSALLWWFHVRDRHAGWWLPLLALQAAAFLIKEDGVMLVPAIVLLHALRRRLVERDLPRVPWRFLAAAAMVGAALLLLRAAALHGTRAPGLPSFDQAWNNWTRALGSAWRLLPAKRHWQPAASWFVTITPLLAIALWRRLSGGVRFAFVSGIVLAVL